MAITGTVEENAFESMRWMFLFPTWIQGRFLTTGGLRQDALLGPEIKCNYKCINTYKHVFSVLEVGLPGRPEGFSCGQREQTVKGR